jgi:glycine/D-amino acid oxidase-like deaminating enzyme
MSLTVRIAGQGICGTLLSWFLAQHDIPVSVYDDGIGTSATMAASGIINPITGKRLVKTWMADELIPAAVQAYTDIGAALGQIIYRPYPIYKLLGSTHETNDWSARAADPAYHAYLPDEQPTLLDPAWIHNPYGSYRITGGGRVDTQLLLSTYRAWLRDRDMLIEQRLELPDANGLTVYCDGAAASTGLFGHLGWLPAKGEYLIIHIPTFYTDRIIAGQVTISPYHISEQLYYVGATYQWGATHAQPTDAGRLELEAGLKAMLAAPYELVYHGAAIRPTVQRRRPYVGWHPAHSHIGVLNGMGTKGMSLAPYFAHQLAANISLGQAIHPDVSL